MHITSKDQTTDPLHNPTGEVVYELIGGSEKTGGTKRHSLAHIVIPPGASSHSHYHKVSEESYYILKGQARIKIDTKDFSLGPGQTCLIEPKERHIISNEGLEDLEFLAVSAPPWTPDDSFQESSTEEDPYQSEAT